MEILVLTVLAILSSAVFCEELPEKTREKKDIGKLQNLGLGYNGGKFNKGFYPSGGYLPPSYNYDYNYERNRGYYPTPQCDCRVPPPPPPSRCGPPYFPGSSYPSAPSRTYGPSRPIPSGPVDDTVVIYPAQSAGIGSLPQVTVNAVAPVAPIRQPTPKLAYENSGYNYDRPSVPFKK